LRAPPVSNTASTSSVVASFAGRQVNSGTPRSLAGSVTRSGDSSGRTKPDSWAYKISRNNRPTLGRSGKGHTPAVPDDPHTANQAHPQRHLALVAGGCDGSRRGGGSECHGRCHGLPGTGPDKAPRGRAAPPAFTLRTAPGRTRQHGKAGLRCWPLPVHVRVCFPYVTALGR
jgi:hypothetical protein